MFQSPQWGDNSKGVKLFRERNPLSFQSPQWGDNSKAVEEARLEKARKFQSPQWGDNSKGTLLLIKMAAKLVSVPAMGR